MEINVTEFFLINAIDSCAVWNILASTKIYTSSLVAGCHYSFTKYVEYECLLKERKTPNTYDSYLKRTLQSEIIKGKFRSYNISIDDLHDIGLLRERKNLGMGELSSIAFAKKTNQSFLTDDKAARKFAKTILGNNKVQTTPHLVGYLFYKRFLIDGDMDLILSQHEQYVDKRWGGLSSFFQEVYLESQRIKLLELSKNYKH